MRMNTFKAPALTILGLATFALALHAMEDEKLNDGAFVKKASSAGLAEVKAGELALQKTSDAKIKSFAQKLIDDHKRANKDLEALAKRKGWLMSKTVDEQCQKQLDLLASATAQEFDRTYVEVQLKAHDSAVKMFEDASQNGQDDALKSWAAKTLPTLRDHLQAAKELSERKDR